MVEAFLNNKNSLSWKLTMFLGIFLIFYVLEVYMIGVESTIFQSTSLVYYTSLI